MGTMSMSVLLGRNIMSRSTVFENPNTTDAKSVAVGDNAVVYDLVDVMDEDNQEWLPLNAADIESAAFEEVTPDAKQRSKG
jgi:hypothetical protein